MGNNSEKTLKVLLGITGAVILILLGVLGFFAKDLWGDVKEIKEKTLPSINKSIITKSDSLDKRVSTNTATIIALASATITDEKIKKIFDGFMKQVVSSFDERFNKMGNSLVVAAVSKKDLNHLNASLAKISKDYHVLNTSINNLSTNFNQYKGATIAPQWISRDYYLEECWESRQKMPITVKDK